MCAFLWKITICQIHIDCEGTFVAHHCISGDGGPKRDCLPRRRTLPRWKQCIVGDGVPLGRFSIRVFEVSLNNEQPPNNRIVTVKSRLDLTKIT